MSTLVSVVIPCYNQAHFLAEAIQSVLDEDYPDKEIIVVNDGSSDNTREVAATFGDQIVYIDQVNLGASAARNAGIRVAQGTYVAFLDSDDRDLPNRIAREASFLDQHPEIGMVCSDALLFDQSGILGLKSACSSRPKNSQNFRWETVEYCATTSTAMVRKTCFQHVGLFDEDLKTAGGEDWQMWVRLALHYDLAYLDEPLVMYRLHSQSATRNLDLINTRNRQAVRSVCTSSYFSAYPAHFRAKLLFYRFATAWHVEPKMAAFGYLLHALATDPIQLPYGLRVIRQGLSNTLRRYLQRLM